MSSVGEASISVRLGLDQLLKDADQARLVLQQQLKDQNIDLNLVTGKASAQLAQLSAQILAAKAAATKDAGEAAGLQRQAALLQELIRYKQQLADIENSGISDEDVAKAKALAAELNKLNVERIENEFKELSAEIEKAEKQGGTFIGKLNAQAQAFQDAVAKSSQYTVALSQASQELGMVGNQINAFTNQAAQAALAFDSARAKVSTLSNDADGLAARMRSLSQELGFQSNSTELLEASYDVLSSGISETADVAEVLRASTQGALGGFSDVGTVSDAVTTLISAYKSMGYTAKDATKIVDILAQTQDKGKITIGQYAQQIGQVASTAALAGVGVEEMSAAVATATAKGQDSSSAISGVRQAIVNILKPTDEAQKYLEKFGITNSAATLKTEGLVGILERLKKGGATTDELSKIFSDVTGLATVATLANENLDDFKGNLDAMANSAGKAALSAEKVSSSMQGQLTAAMNQANEALVDLGKGASNAITPLLQALTFLVENFNKLPAPVKESVGAVIAITGGAVTLVGALAGLAAAAPIVAAGFTAITGTATATGVALVPLLPLLIAVAAGVAAIKFALLVKEMGDANLAIDAATQQIQSSSDAAFSAASRTKSAVDALTKAKKDGRAISKEEIAEADRLYKSNEQRLTQLKEDLKLAEQLPAANEAQAQSKKNLIQQTQTTIKALEGQNSKLKEFLPTNQKVAASNKAVEVSLETVTKKYEDSTAKIEAANRLKQTEIAESAAQGLISEEQAQEQSLEQETKFLNERLKLNQAKLNDLLALKDTTKDPAKLKEINAAVLQTEQALADSRLAIAQDSIQKRQAAEQKALEELERKISEAQGKVEQSKTARTLDVKQQQASGNISEEEAAKRIAQIEQDAIAQSIQAKQQELADIKKLEDSKEISAKEAAERRAEANTDLSNLAIQQVDAEIAAQKALADEQKARVDEQKQAQRELLNEVEQAASDATAATALAATDRITAVKQAQLAGVLSEKDAARQIAAIQAETTAKTLAIKQQELADVQALRKSGEVTIEEGAELERELISEIAGLKQQSVEADLAAQAQVKQAKLAALDEELAATQAAAEVAQGQRDLEIQSIQNRSNLISAQSNLMQAQTALTQQRLQFAIQEAEQAGNLTQAEALKKQLVDEQIRAQEQQFKIDLEQLKLQQEQNKLEMENAQINAQIAVTEAEINLQKAQASGASAQEIANLTSLLGLRNQQLEAINGQIANQSKLNSLEQQALRTQQQMNREKLNQQKITASTAATTAAASSSTGGFSSGGGSPASAATSTGGEQKGLSLTAAADKMMGLAMSKGTLADVFNASNMGLKMKLNDDFGSGFIRGNIGGGNSEIAGKLDQLIAATRSSAGRPNLSISNVNDLGMAGQIYGDISRDSFRSAGL